MTEGSLLDRFVPAFDVNETHSMWMNAEPAEVLAAARAVTAGEVRSLGPLMALRTLPGRLARRPLPVESGTPFLEQALAVGFVRLAEEPNSEVVLGAIGRWWSLSGNRPLTDIRTAEDFTAFNRPGYAKAAMNFRVRPEGAGTRLSTETRIAGTDRAAARKFRLYWLVIGPFSALIRRGMLAAVRRRLDSE